MKKTITLDPLDDTAADLLHTAVMQLAGKVDNRKHADLLRGVAASLEQPTHTVGELDPIGGFLLQTAARMMAVQTADPSHATILHTIALELNTKIHANKLPHEIHRHQHHALWQASRETYVPRSG